MTEKALKISIKANKQTYEQTDYQANKQTVRKTICSAFALTCERLGETTLGVPLGDDILGGELKFGSISRVFSQANSANLLTLFLITSERADEIK